MEEKKKEKKKKKKKKKKEKKKTKTKKTLGPGLERRATQRSLGLDRATTTGQFTEPGRDSKEGTLWRRKETLRPVQTVWARNTLRQYLRER